MKFNLLVIIAIIVILILYVYRTEGMTDVKEVDDSIIDVNQEDEVIEETPQNGGTVMDEQLKSMMNAKDKYLPDESQIAEADISKVDAQIIKDKSNSTPFFQNSKQYGIPTFTQSKSKVSSDTRPLPIVEKIPDEMLLFDRSNLEADPYRDNPAYFDAVQKMSKNTYSTGMTTNPGFENV